MFELKDDGLLMIDLPQGKSQEELVASAKAEIKQLIALGLTYGKDIKLNGRLTTGMALMLGHELAHVSKSVSIFDPKENSYILCIKH
jgi:hypothetical protein